jgi:hypothetical protein
MAGFICNATHACSRARTLALTLAITLVCTPAVIIALPVSVTLTLNLVPALTHIRSPARLPSPPHTRTPSLSICHWPLPSDFALCRSYPALALSLTPMRSSFTATTRPATRTYTASSFCGHLGLLQGSHFPHTRTSLVRSTSLKTLGWVSRAGSRRSVRPDSKDSNGRHLQQAGAHDVEASDPLA